MNKQVKDKAKEIAKEYGINFPKSHSSAYPLCYKAALDMAACKEQQMIEKAVEMFHKDSRWDYIFGVYPELINDFRKYMEEN